MDETEQILAALEANITEIRENKSILVAGVMDLTESDNTCRGFVIGSIKCLMDSLITTIAHFNLEELEILASRVDALLDEKAEAKHE